MASIKKRRNKWYAVWYQNGKQMCKSTGIDTSSPKNKRLAQNTADAMEAMAKDTHTLNKALDAVRNAAELAGFSGNMPSIREYFTAYKPNGTESHRRNVKRGIGIFLDYLGATASRRLDNLSAVMCRGFLEHQIKRISYGTVQNYKGIVSCVLNRAVEDELLMRNPIQNLRISALEATAGEKATKRLPFTKDDLRIIFTQFPQPWRDIAMTSFLTGGQRLGDIVTLKWKDIDFAGNVIHFRTMKTGKEISSPIIPKLRDILVANKNESEYVFPNSAKTYIRSAGSLSTSFSALLKAHGIIEESQAVRRCERRNVAQKSFHSLRHSVVSMMRTDNRFTADLTRDIVGHDSEDIERGYYTADYGSKQNALQFLIDEVNAG